MGRADRATKTEEKYPGPEYYGLRPKRAIDKERASLEALRRIARHDSDRPSLALYFILEAFKWGGTVTVLYLFLRFLADYFELM